MADDGPISGVSATRRLRRAERSLTRQRPRPAPKDSADEKDDQDAPPEEQKRKGRFVDERC